MIFTQKYKSQPENLEVLARLNNDEKLLLIAEAYKKGLQPIESENDLRQVLSYYRKRKGEITAIWEFLSDWDYRQTAIDFVLNQLDYSLEGEHVVLSKEWIHENFARYPDVEDYRDYLIEKKTLNISDDDELETDELIDIKMARGEIYHANNGYIIAVPENFPWFENTFLKEYK